MKKLKPLIILLILIVIADFAFVFIDDGNKLETVSHDATVVSCDLKGNTGLDTYYIVKYEYTDGDDKISGTDNYYQKKVSKGDKITVTTRETVVSSYAGYLFYGQIAIKQFDLDGNLIATYPSIKEAHRQTNIEYSAIAYCVRGVYKTSGGYYWERATTIRKE